MPSSPRFMASESGTTSAFGPRVRSRSTACAADLAARRCQERCDRGAPGATFHLDERWLDDETTSLCRDAFDEDDACLVVRAAVNCAKPLRLETAVAET